MLQGIPILVKYHGTHLLKWYNTTIPFICTDTLWLTVFIRALLLHFFSGHKYRHGQFQPQTENSCLFSVSQITAGRLMLIVLVHRLSAICHSFYTVNTYKLYKLYSFFSFPAYSFHLFIYPLNKYMPLSHRHTQTVLLEIGVDQRFLRSGLLFKFGPNDKSVRTQPTRYIRNAMVLCNKVYSSYILKNGQVFIIHFVKYQIFWILTGVIAW